MKKLVMFLFILLSLSFVSGISEEFIFERLQNSTLTFTCTDDATGLPCDIAYDCTLTGYYPNGSNLFQSVNATRIGDDYQLPLGNLSVNGFYPYSGFCSNGTDSAKSDDLNFLVTETGRTFNEGQGLASLGIMFGSLSLAFFFLILGFKFTNNQSTLPLSLFFVIIAIFIAFYSLVLGLNFADSILELESVAGLQSSLFTALLFLVSGIGLITFFLFTIAFVREFGKGKMMKNFGEGFDPLTQTYT